MVEVPIHCLCNISLSVDIDIAQKPALRAKLIQIIEDLKVEFPDKITDNKWSIATSFAEEGGKV